MNRQTSRSGAEAFCSRHRAVLGRVQGPLTNEERCFLLAEGFETQEDPDVYYSKVLHLYYLFSTGKLSSLYPAVRQTWGTTWGGDRCLVAAIKEPRIGKVCLLQDILEDQVDSKYFLSKDAVLKVKDWKRDGRKCRGREQELEDTDSDQTLAKAPTQ